MDRVDSDAPGAPARHATLGCAAASLRSTALARRAPIERHRESAREGAR
ncbi:hypothetical protein QFZ74_005381 [Streptomyces sp. V3I7]|nr:hypothetical protein [Streptomyces sp. V3I7]